MKISTKWKGDLAEQMVVVEAMKMGIDVSIPVGDRLTYDLIFDVNNSLLRIQVKCAWFDKCSNNYITDTRMCKTNRKNYRFEKYSNNDFDFAIIVVMENNSFYIMPSDVFNLYKSSVTLAEFEKRQRSPRSLQYKNAWYLLSE